MKKCYMCDNEIKDEAKFCNKCGANQAEAENATVVTEEEAPQAVEEVAVATPEVSEELTQTTEDTPEVVIAPTKIEQKVTEVAAVAAGVAAAASEHVDTAEIKQKASDYWQYFVKTLKHPGAKVTNLPKHYGFVSMGVYALAAMVLTWAVPDLLFGSMPYSEEAYFFYNASRLGGFAGDIILWFGIAVFVALLANSGVLFLTQRYVLRRAVTYTYVVDRYASYLAVGSATMVIAGLVMKLNLGYTLAGILLLALAIQTVMISFVVPILIIATEERKGSRELPVFYSILVNAGISAIVGFILSRLFD